MVLGPDDAVVMAVPAYAAASLVPGLTTPDQFRAIINIHYDLAPPAGSPFMTGVINRTVEWIFAFKQPHFRHHQPCRPAAHPAPAGDRRNGVA